MDETRDSGPKSPHLVALMASGSILLAGFTVATYCVQLRGPGLAQRITAHRPEWIVLGGLLLGLAIAVHLAVVRGLHAARGAASVRGVLRRALEVLGTAPEVTENSETLPREVRELVSLFASQRSKEHELERELQGARREMKDLLQRLEESSARREPMNVEGASDFTARVARAWNQVVSQAGAAPAGLAQAGAAQAGQPPTAPPTTMSSRLAALGASIPMRDTSSSALDEPLAALDSALAALRAPLGAAETTPEALAAEAMESDAEAAETESLPEAYPDFAPQLGRETFPAFAPEPAREAPAAFTSAQGRESFPAFTPEPVREEPPIFTREPVRVAPPAFRPEPVHEPISAFQPGSVQEEQATSAAPRAPMTPEISRRLQELESRFSQLREEMLAIQTFPPESPIVEAVPMLEPEIVLDETARAAPAPAVPLFLEPEAELVPELESEVEAELESPDPAWPTWPDAAGTATPAAPSLSPEEDIRYARSEVVRPEAPTKAGDSGYFEWTGQSRELGSWKLREEAARELTRPSEASAPAPRQAAPSPAPSGSGVVPGSPSFETKFPHFTGKPVGNLEGRVAVSFEGTSKKSEGYRQDEEFDRKR